MKDISYASMIESIIYAMQCTRLGVTIALSVTIMFQADLGEKYYELVKYILK